MAATPGGDDPATSRGPQDAYEASVRSLESAEKVPVPQGRVHFGHCRLQAQRLLGSCVEPLAGDDVLQAAGLQTSPASPSLHLLWCCGPGQGLVQRSRRLMKSSMPLTRQESKSSWRRIPVQMLRRCASSCQAGEWRLAISLLSVTMPEMSVSPNTVWIPFEMSSGKSKKMSNSKSLAPRPATTQPSAPAR